MQLDANTIRSEFNRQHPNHAGPQWVRLNLPTGPVLARRQMKHHSAQIYVLVIDGEDRHKIARHYMVTQKRELKSSGTANPSVSDNARWVELIGYTEREYRIASGYTGSSEFTQHRIALYEARE